MIATHDMDMALELCDRVIVLKEGVIFADGIAKDILTNEALMSESGLELPFAAKNATKKRSSTTQRISKFLLDLFVLRFYNNFPKGVPKP